MLCLIVTYFRCLVSPLLGFGCIQRDPSPSSLKMLVSPPIKANDPKARLFLLVYTSFKIYCYISVVGFLFLAFIETFLNALSVGSIRVKVQLRDEWCFKGGREI